MRVAEARSVISEPMETADWSAATTRPAVLGLAVISDDQTLAVRAAAALEREGKLVTIDAAAAEVSAVSGLERDPDLALVRRAGNRPGLEHLLHELRRRLPRTKRVAVLPVPEDIEVGRLLAAGADGIVPEASLQPVLGVVVDAVTAGFVCVPTAMRHAIDPPSLSFRERQVLALAVTGCPNAEIAQRLYLSESTVKSHLASAYRQLGVHSRREACSVVLASGDALRRSVLGTLGAAGGQATEYDR
jgi:two-component system response regulator DesR